MGCQRSPMQGTRVGNSIRDAVKLLKQPDFKILPPPPPKIMRDWRGTEKPPYAESSNSISDEEKNARVAAKKGHRAVAARKDRSTKKDLVKVVYPAAERILKSMEWSWMVR